MCILSTDFTWILSLLPLSHDKLGKSGIVNHEGYYHSPADASHRDSTIHSTGTPTFTCSLSHPSFRLSQRRRLQDGPSYPICLSTCGEATLLSCLKVGTCLNHARVFSVMSVVREECLLYLLPLPPPSSIRWQDSRPIIIVIDSRNRGLLEPGHVTIKLQAGNWV